jgi:two-component system, NarL family, sensor histidine kinase UhpB
MAAAGKVSANRRDLAFLEAVNCRLDQLVKRRTLDLVSANRRLLRESATRRKAELALERSRDELRSLAEHLHLAQEAERMRIARELHDQVGQVLSALKIDVRCLGTPPLDRQHLRKRGAEMSRHLDAAIRCVRTACSNLRVPVLEDFGLATAITYHLERVQERSGLRCAARLDPTLPPLDQGLSLVLYRVFQEAVSNVVRHAEARSIRVTLRRERGQAVLAVRDDGSGFDDQAEIRNGSFGLLGIRERVRAWGGRSEFRSIVGKGTAVVVRMPIAPRNAGAPLSSPSSAVGAARPRPRRTRRRTP